jgi:hypothetical protein
MGIAFLKAQAWHEAGKPYPAPAADWVEAQRIVFSGAKPAPKPPVTPEVTPDAEDEDVGPAPVPAPVPRPDDPGVDPDDQPAAEPKSKFWRAVRWLGSTIFGSGALYYMTDWQVLAALGALAIIVVILGLVIARIFFGKNEIREWLRRQLN